MGKEFLWALLEGMLSWLAGRSSWEDRPIVPGLIKSAREGEAAENSGEALRSRHSLPSFSPSQERERERGREKRELGRELAREIT